MMEIREIQRADLPALLTLYTHLHEETMPPQDEKLEAVWRRIASDPGHHILLGLEEGAVVSSCVLVVVANLTRGLRPYALIENVVTHPQHRGKGYASALLAHAKQLAQQAGCYKMMLLTGAKWEGTLQFYERAGYNRKDKTAFIQWLDVEG